MKATTTRQRRSSAAVWEPRRRALRKLEAHIEGHDCAPGAIEYVSMATSSAMYASDAVDGAARWARGDWLDACDALAGEAACPARSALVQMARQAMRG